MHFERRKKSPESNPMQPENGGYERCYEHTFWQMEIPYSVGTYRFWENAL